MRKLLLTLFVSLCGLVSFWFWASNCISPGDSDYYYNGDNYTNCDYNDPLIVCVYWQAWAVEFPNYWPTYNLQNSFICTLLQRWDYIYVNSWNNWYQVIVFPTVSPTPSCDGSLVRLSFFDSNTNNTSNYDFNLSDWDFFSTTININTLYDNFTNSNNIFSVLPKTSTINAVSDYSTCSSSLNSCKTTLNNAMCETHIQFQDISNLTWVKTLSSHFSPFSGANNNSVYYDSTENVIQIDNYWDAEVISSVPSVPPCDECEDCSIYQTSLSGCLSDYSTLSWNYNSCLWELNSCMSNSNCSWTWTNWSALFVNNIQHLWKPIINITIPDEISWDYNSTWDLFDLSVVGYNQDSDYIESIINLQNTKPTEDDFNKIVSEIIPLFVPWLLIIAFIYFIFRFIRKIF